MKISSSGTCRAQSTRNGFRPESRPSRTVPEKQRREIGGINRSFDGARPVLSRERLRTSSTGWPAASNCRKTCGSASSFCVGVKTCGSPRGSKRNPSIASGRNTRDHRSPRSFFGEAAQLNTGNLPARVAAIRHCRDAGFAESQSCRRPRVMAHPGNPRLALRPYQNIVHHAVSRSAASPCVLRTGR